MDQSNAETGNRHKKASKDTVQEKVSDDASFTPSSGGPVNPKSLCGFTVIDLSNAGGGVEIHGGRVMPIRHH